MGVEPNCAAIRRETRKFVKQVVPRQVRDILKRHFIACGGLP